MGANDRRAANRTPRSTRISTEDDAESGKRRNDPWK
jgi:hypothetical protein